MSFCVPASMSLRTTTLGFFPGPDSNATSRTNFNLQIGSPESFSIPFSFLSRMNGMDPLNLSISLFVGFLFSRMGSMNQKIFFSKWVL